jgi:acetylornithine deacetylase/succinyl-diaminopimelate desuccinylase-like protein
MNFQFPAEVQEMQRKLRHFIDEEVLPHLAEYESIAASGTFPSSVVEPLKERARKANLWNLFLPGLKEDEPGMRLTNMEYAPLAEIMGRIPWAAEIFNCNAPDTGNMELLHLFATAEQRARWLRPFRPTFEVHGITGGFIGEGSKTIIPAQATAKVSMRLVANQDPKKIKAQFVHYVETLAPPTVEVEVVPGSLEYPSLVQRDDPAIVAATLAYEQVFGVYPVFTREGGSIPVVAMCQQILNLPVVLMGFGLPDDNLHAPNEKFHLPNFERGILTAIHFLTEYARLKSPGS